MRGQAELPDFPHLDDEPTDKVDRMLARKRRALELEEAKTEIRQNAKNESVKKWLDILPKLLGPEPTTGQEWIDRGIRMLELSQIEGLGINAKAAAAYAEEANKRAAWMDPVKFGKQQEALPPSADSVPTQFLEAILRMGRDDLERYVLGAMKTARNERPAIDVTPTRIEAGTKH